MNLDRGLDEIVKEQRSARRGRGGRGAARGATARAPRGASTARRGGAAAGGGARAPAPVAARTSRVAPAASLACLHVSNLHFNVSEKDLRELFSQTGSVQRVRMHFDKSGRSLGEADVFFPTVGEVNRSISKFTGMALDGQPLVLERRSSTPTPADTGASPILRQRAGPTRGGVARRNAPAAPVASTRGRGGGRGRGRGGRTPRAPVSQEQLDAALDSYRAAQA